MPPLVFSGTLAGGVGEITDKLPVCRCEEEYEHDVNEEEEEVSARVVSTV